VSRAAEQRGMRNEMNGAPNWVRKYFVALGISAGLGGCAQDWAYVPPNLPPQAVAVITGSKLVDSAPLTPDTRAYLVAIDGKLTSDGPRGWDDRTLAAPGEHMIKFGIGKSAPFLKDAWGFGETKATLEPGQTYTIRASQPLQVTSVCATAEGWLETGDGKPAADKVPVMIMTYTGAEIGLPGGGVVNIPSHTSCPPPR
jgi:hypothetical protein